MEIQSLYDRRDKIFKAYKAEPTDPIFLEVIEDKKQRIAFLKGEQTKINTDFGGGERGRTSQKVS